MSSLATDPALTFAQSLKARLEKVKAGTYSMECRACMAVIKPIIKQVTVMAHQSGDCRQFSLYSEILCCPKCGERDL